MKGEILRLEGIGKQYGTKTVLDISTLSVEKGSVHALVGPNGSGKTTLLEIAALIGKPSRGSVHVLGKEGTADEKVRRKLRREVTLVDQNPYLFDTTVFRNVAFGLEARGMARAEIDTRVGEALDSVGLGSLSGRRAGRLSAGETQRVALARAMALRPSLLLLDEPTANVDRFHVQVLESLIREAVEEKGATVIFATHSLAQSYRLAGRVHHLVEGRLSAAPPENHFSGVREDERGESFLRLAPGVRVVLPETGKRRVRFSIPPGEILLSREEVSSTVRNTFQGRVVGMSGDSDRIQVTVDVGVNLVSLITRESLDALNLRVGDNIHLSFKVFSIHLY